jgi:hypothetical protein
VVDKRQKPRVSRRKGSSIHFLHAGMANFARILKSGETVQGCAGGPRHSLEWSGKRALCDGLTCR